MRDPYPIVRSDALDAPASRGLLGLGRKRREAVALPHVGAHEVLVFRVDDRYVVDRAELSLDGDQVVRADQVILVNVAEDVPVTAELTVPSAEAADFTVRVTFACTVTDPARVVRENLNAESVLLAYLRRDTELSHLALNYRMSDLYALRRDVTARIRAYSTVKPPAAHGLRMSLVGVEVLTPEEVAAFEQLRRQAAQERDVAAVRQQRQEQRLQAETLEFRRRQLELALETIGADPIKALIMAQTRGELDAKELADGLARLEREREEREDKLDHRREAREDHKRQLEMKLEVLRELAKNGHLDMVNVKVDQLFADLSGSGHELSAPQREAVNREGVAPMEQPEEGERPSAASGSASSWSTGGDERPPITDSPGQAPRFLVAEAPSQVPLGAELSLVVRITSAKPGALPAAAARLSDLIVAEDGTPVTVTVHAPPALHLGGPRQHTFLVLPRDDPAPVRFGLAACRIGLHRIEVMAWAGGTFLASVSVELSVAANGSYGLTTPKVAPLYSMRSQPGEATMEVRYTGGHYEFQLRSDLALFPPVTISVAQEPRSAVEQALGTLRQLADGSRQHDQATTRRLLRASGTRLWNEMVPELIRDQFWQIRSHMTAFTIATDYDALPWEILYPLDAGQDEGFLVERIPVVRRTYGQFRAFTVNVREPHFVVPSGGPKDVAAEIAAIRSIVGGGQPITTMSAFLELVESGAMGAAHFACHSTFGFDGSRIMLDDGALEPWMLSAAEAQRALASSQPAVFINACRSAGTAPSYTSMMGWAQKYMAAGAGAFVGTLWAVRSSSSAQFAAAFYQALMDGAMLGEAAHAARTAEHEDLLDPTWLAYTVYGDPFAVAA